MNELKARAEADGIRVFFISALHRQGIDELLQELWRMLAEVDRHAPLVRLRPVQTEEGADLPDREARADGDDEGEAEVIWTYEA